MRLVESWEQGEQNRGPGHLQQLEFISADCILAFTLECISTSFAVGKVCATWGSLVVDPTM